MQHSLRRNRRQQELCSLGRYAHKLHIYSRAGGLCPALPIKRGGICILQPHNKSLAAPLQYVNICFHFCFLMLKARGFMLALQMLQPRINTALVHVDLLQFFGYVMQLVQCAVCETAVIHVYTNGCRHTHKCH